MGKLPMDKHAKNGYTLIGEGAVFQGELVVPHALRIDGTLRGKVETGEMLTIGKTAVVEADVIAKSAIIGGTVKGNLVVQDRLELESEAKMVGDLKTRELVINDGAVFHGNCSMDRGEETKV